MNFDKYLVNNTSSLRDKTICITGATGDICKQLCFILAKLEANLFFINRNENKTIKLKEEILKEYPNSKIDYLIMDLESFKTVKEKTKQLLNYKIDILILGAGIYKVEKRVTDIGYNNIFTINFISQYYLANKLINNGCKKVIAISSIAYNFNKIDLDDIDFSSRTKCNKIYGNSKRFLMSSLYSLNQENNNFDLSIVHPGITFTKMTSHFPKLIYLLIKYPMKIIFISKKKASLSILKGVFDKCNYLEWIGPKYFNIWGLPNKSKVKNLTKEEINNIDIIAKDIYKKISSSN